MKKHDPTFASENYVLATLYRFVFDSYYLQLGSLKIIK